MVIPYENFMNAKKLFYQFDEKIKAGEFFGEIF